MVTALLDHYAPIWWGYTFGYELLMLNGGLTALGLFALRRFKNRFVILHTSLALSKLHHANES